MKLELTPKTERTHSAIFEERYKWLLNWALKLTRGEREEAEDILHDAYTQFLRLAPSLQGIGNLDAYLNRMIRNLHLSRVMRRSRVPMVQIDALDYDSIHFSVDAIDPFKMLPLQQQLHKICDWGCTRRSKTKAASILLLRYFLNYLPSEICLLCLCNRQSVEKSLQLARREIRIPQGGAEVQIGANLYALPVHSGAPFTMAMNPAELEASLRRKIFDAPSGGCLSIFEMETMYKAGQPIESSVIAHLTGCESCLDRANRLLGLPTLAERSMMDSGRDGDDPPRGRDDVPSMKRLAPRGERSIQRIYEHRPAQLTIQVDADRRATMGVHAVKNHFELEVGRSRPIQFIEIFSEQDVRLLYLPVVSLDEGGEYRQEASIEMSDGRMLRLELWFTQPRPTITLSYVDPLFQALRETATRETVLAEMQAVPAKPVLQTSPSRWGLIHRLQSFKKQAYSLARMPFQSVPRIISMATALLLIVLLPFLQTKETTLQAEVLLAHAADWQRGVTTGTDNVLHRSFDYFESANQPDPAHRRVTHHRVEVWRQSKSGHAVTRLFNDAGQLVGTASGVVSVQLAYANAWQFEPSADTFRLVAGNSRPQVVQAENSYAISAGRVELDLDKNSYRPVREVFHLQDGDVEFRERSTESVPVEMTPLAELHTPAVPAVLSNAVRQGIDLDMTEIQVRTKLHDLQADLGDDIHVIRTPQGVRISGIVTPEEKRQLLVADLRPIPGVVVALRSPEQASSEENHHAAVRVMSVSQDANAAPLLEDWLKSRYPDEQERSTSVEQVLTLADQCIFRAHALDELVKRYQGFSDPAIHVLATDHARALNESVRAVDHWLAAVPGKDHALPAEDVAAFTPRQTTEAMVHSSQELEDGLADLVAARAGEHGSDPPQTAATLARCRRNMDALMRLTKNIQ